MNGERQSETVVLVGGPRDGVRVAIDPGQATITVPCKAVALEAGNTGLVARLTPRTTYVRVQMQFVDGAVTFYRLSTITDRQALLQLASGYPSGDDRPER